MTIESRWNDDSMVAALSMLGRWNDDRVVGMTICGRWNDDVEGNCGLAEPPELQKRAKRSLE